MYHLIKKDILMQKRTLGLSLVFVIFFTLILADIGPAGLTMGIFVITYMLVLGASALEDKNNSDMMLASLPINKKTIVLSKYISVYVFTAYAALLFFVTYLLIKLFNLPIAVLPFTVEGIVSSVVAATLFSAISLPLIFKFGYLRSKIVTIIIFSFIMSVGIYFVGQLSNTRSSLIAWKIKGFLNKGSDVQITLVVLMLLALVTIISYLISLRFYTNREY